LPKRQWHGGSSRASATHQDLAHLTPMKAYQTELGVVDWHIGDTPVPRCDTALKLVAVSTIMEVAQQ
tara:strand:- start:35588 stop:35788 length:201 start_codon:yes stop_codon:yes gene_type:complete